MKQKQNIAYTFLIFFCLLAYTHYDYVVAENMKIGGPLFVAMSICNMALDAAVVTFISWVIRRRWYNAAVSVVFWLFCMMNVLYLRHFNTYVDVTLVGELRNVDILGESIIALTTWRDIVVSVLYFAAIWLLMWRKPLRYTQWIKGYTMPIVAVLSFVSLYGLVAKGERVSFVEALNYMNENVVSMPYHRGYQLGFVHYVGYDLSRLTVKRDITAQEKRMMEDYGAFRAAQRKADLQGKLPNAATEINGSSRPQNVVFMLMEGILSDVVTTVCDGDTVMPHLWAIADSAQYCNMNMESETNIGWSSDGQLIYMTGMMPHSDRNTVNNFTYNTFQGLGTACKKLGMQTAMLLPTGRHIWRQEDMCNGYGIDSLYNTVVFGEDPDDRLMDFGIGLLDKIGGKPFFLTVLNFSTHTPFYDHFPLRLRTFHGKGVPQDKIGFYERANFFDYHLDRFLKALKKKGLWENTLVVLASDHHLEEWMENNKRGKIPFIITGGYHSPLLPERVKSSENIYQTDFYPTMLALLGVEQKWSGVGRNLFSSNSKRMSKSDKQQLSDMILETNWFAHNK